MIELPETYEPLDRLPTGAAFPFGCITPKPVRTCLPGRIRLRLRANQFPSAIVRNPGVFARRFMIIDCGNHYQLGFEHGANVHYRGFP